MAIQTLQPELPMIETLRARHNIGRAVFAGVCTANGWQPGRAMTEDAFLAAVAEFINAPMSGGTDRESEAKK